MKYKVYWQTKPGIGATFYNGSQIINFEDEEGSEEEASSIIQRSVWRDFKEYSLNHIQITKVESL